MDEFDEYRKNPKTSYLAGRFDELERELDEIAEMAETDPSFKPMAEEEKARLGVERDELLKKMKEIVKEENAADDAFPSEMALEVRAGTGGEEAALFARDLATMYQRFAERQGWQFQAVSE